MKKFLFCMDQSCLFPAVWNYEPSDGVGYYCEEHVPRGCSCQLEYDPETGNCDGPPLLDSTGRLMPCVEYDFYEDGVPDE